MSISLVEQFIVSLGLVYTGFIFLHIILGYLQLSYSPWLGRLRALTYDTVEPYLRWWRNIIPSAGGLDFSPIVAIIAINVGVGIVLTVLSAFA
jgi:YggT family protein